MMRFPNKFSHYVLQEINPVVRFLILSDVILLGASGLLGPVFALFIEDFISGGNAAVAGLAAAIFLLTKSVAQIPVARFIDNRKGERDDFWVMFVFTLMVSLTPLLYLVVDTPMQLYLVQFLLGLLTAFTFPTFMALFTRHIDRAHEGVEWGIYFSLTDLSSAAMAAVGGYIAFSEGFEMLIFWVVGVSLLGSLMLWPIRRHLYKTNRGLRL